MNDKAVMPPLTLVEEQAAAVGLRRVWAQSTRPQHDLPDERRWLEGIRAAEGAPLRRACPSLRPHQQFTVIEKWNRLQTVDGKLGERFGITGAVDQDG